MIKVFVQTGKSEYPCPECGGGMVTETIPFNVVVHKCLDCKTIHTKEYLAGWYDAANEFCNIKSESFGEFRSTIAALTTRLQEAEAVIKPVYVKHTQDAVDCNFQICGCEYCEAYRKAFEGGN